MNPIPEPIAVEARAKIMWGESQEKVRAFLIAKNVDAPDAGALLEEIAAERAESIRRDGTKKIGLGALYVAVPIAYYLLAHHILGYWSVKGFAALIVLGAVGLAKITQGLPMVFRPRTVAGDLSNATD